MFTERVTERCLTQATEPRIHEERPRNPREVEQCHVDEEGIDATCHDAALAGHLAAQARGAETQDRRCGMPFPPAWRSSRREMLPRAGDSRDITVPIGNCITSASSRDREPLSIRGAREVAAPDRAHGS